MKIKLTKKNLKILEGGFKEAPKTYEESLKTGRFVPFEKGMKYKDRFFAIEAETKIP